MFYISTSFKAPHTFFSLTRVEIVVMARVRISQGVLRHLILSWPPATLSILPSLRHSYPPLISPFIHIHNSLDSLEIKDYFMHLIQTRINPLWDSRHGDDCSSRAQPQATTIALSFFLTLFPHSDRFIVINPE